MSNDEIEFVARAMCDALGLDPDKSVSVGDGATGTPLDRSARGGAYNCVSYSVAQWEAYRHHAAIAIASDHAVRVARLQGFGNFDNRSGIR